MRTKKPAFVAVVDGERVCVFRANNADHALKKLTQEEGPLLENLFSAFHADADGRANGRGLVWDGVDWPALRYADDDEYKIWRQSLRVALKHGAAAGRNAPLPDHRIDPANRYSWFAYLVPIARAGGGLGESAKVLAFRR